MDRLFAAFFATFGGIIFLAALVLQSGLGLLIGGLIFAVGVYGVGRKRS